MTLILYIILLVLYIILLNFTKKNWIRNLSRVTTSGS